MDSFQYAARQAYACLCQHNELIRQVLQLYILQCSIPALDQAEPMLYSLIYVTQGTPSRMATAAHCHSCQPLKGCTAAVGVGLQQSLG